MPTTNPSYILASAAGACQQVNKLLPMTTEPKFAAMTDDSAIACVVSAEIVDADVELEMSTIEARECVSEIKDHLNKVRALLLDLDERRGWKALGYESMRQCMIYEFKDTGSKLRQLYRELKAAHIEKVVCPHGHIGAIPEGHLRDLSKLPPEQWSNAWSEVIATAPPKGVTTKHVSNVVQHLLEQSKQGKTATTVEQQEGFSIGDWVKIQRSGTWYGMQGSVNRIEEHEITVQLNEGKWKHLRFYREELLKTLTFEQSTSSQNSFYHKGDLLIIDCPTGVDCDYKSFNGCWAIVNGIGELGSIEVQLAGRKMRVKKSDTEPIDNPSVVLKEIAEKVTTLLGREDLDSFDRRFLEMYLREQSFSDVQCHRLEHIYDYYFNNLGNQ